ncbi:RNA polymerase sigma factor [Paraglaciecola arctica]|uniref:RNA polymerase sigma factor n=1 Tax=Paraglaciecola arctica TaxID=1128911 RepID=UPI001C07443B|nr:RNA polymerase sigma factor [Paraglaciecola arctica]MBU3002832.1 RNA polymerase sigma factor [Paraglaciecola arctica]
MQYKSTMESTYLKCSALLAKVIGGIVKNEDVEDIVQETFIKSYEAGLKQEIKFERTYMLKTARNLALNHVSKASERKNQSLDEMKDLPGDLTSKSLESQIESKERFLNFCRATDTLSVEVKRVFLLKKVYGMSQRDIARHIGISESTVEKHVAKGLYQCSLYLQQLVESETQQVTSILKHGETNK